MDLAVAMTLAAALGAVSVAGLAWRLARAPIWSDLRLLAGVAAFTALYGLLEVASVEPLSPLLFAVVSHALGATSPLVARAWLRHAIGILGGAPRRLDLWLAAGLLGASAVALVPRLAVDASAPPRAPLTPVGLVIVALILLVTLRAIYLLAAAWRRGNRQAGALALSFAAAMPFAVSDSAAHADLWRAPHLLTLALSVPLAVASWLAAARFISDADALQGLRARLEALVEERTRELAEANAALLQAEKLAALGQFAAGVAHEVNNPASVVTANLAWLSGALAQGPPTPEAREVLNESLDSMWRINDLVRKLLDAGRLADLPPGTGTVALAGAVERAFTELRQRVPPEVALYNRVPDDLLVRGGASTVESILSNLVANGVEAIPSGRTGHVEVSALADGPVVRLIVSDDGAGMPVDALRRAFDPFFTTKPQGRGNGLGLPITRGLVEGIGGQIWLESEPGKGTRAAVELPLATPS